MYLFQVLWLTGGKCASDDEDEGFGEDDEDEDDKDKVDNDEVDFNLLYLNQLGTLK